MQGQSRSVKTDDLSLIFFKIRASRCSKTRRSWLRRARLALEKIQEISKSERHEILCVWSQSNVSHIDSAALRKLHGTVKQDHQTIESKRFTRRKFTINLIANQAINTLPSNDEYFNVRCNDARINLASERFPPVTVDCKFYCATFEAAFLLRSTGDNVAYPLLNGIRERQHPRRERIFDLKMPKLKLKIINASLKPPLNKSTKFAVDNEQTVLSVDSANSKEGWILARIMA